MKSRPEITEQEINKFMDFERLLIEKERLEAGNRNKFLLYGIIGVIAIFTAGYFLIDRNSAETVKSNPTTLENPFVPQESLEEKETVPSDPEPVSQQPVTTPGSTKKKASGSSANANESKTSDQKPEQTGESTPNRNVYVQAEPVNGYPALYTFFENELTYPPSALRDSVTGVVTVIFTIDSKGKPVNIQVENSLGAAFDVEAKRVIEKMPPWQPASYNGNPVPSKISVPLTFDIRKVSVNK